MKADRLTGNDKKGLHEKTVAYVNKLEADVKHLKKKLARQSEKAKKSDLEYDAQLNLYQAEVDQTLLRFKDIVEGLRTEYTLLQIAATAANDELVAAGLREPAVEPSNLIEFGGGDVVPG